MVIVHVSCPAEFRVGEIEGSTGRRPLGKQEGLEGRRPPNCQKLIQRDPN